MRKLIAIGVSIILVAAVALFVLGGTASAKKKPPKAGGHDFALYDNTSGDVAVSCQGTKDFEVYASLRAINGDAVARVTFLDGDFVDYPIPNNTSFSLAQAAGGTPSVDGKIVIKKAPTSVGNLVGWMSASVHAGGSVSCTTA